MCDRIVRSVVIARDCGAEVAVVLTKADCVSLEAVKDAVKVVRATLGTEISVVVTAAGAASDWRGPDSINAGIERLRSLICPYTVAIVLGQSGAGKSSLLNALLGRDTLCVGKVRTSDGAGRHTTVSRRMVGLAGAGAIVDEPGLRSLPLMGHERGLALVFPEIVSAAQACRFRDCTHTSEPGCAVREALAHGSFSAEHLNAYLSLAAEMRDSAAGLDPDILP
jgi:ribosome biogenesis GTPase